jgi:hypothetical protein
VITGAPWPTPTEVTVRVLGIQAKLHRWASEDPARRFDDLFNLVVDPAVLLMAWRRVRSNRGARTAGVDGSTAHYIEAVRGVESFLAELRADLVAQQFVPLPAWERLIPKSGGRVRRLGIRISRPRRSKSSMSGRTSRRRAGHGRIYSTTAVLLHGCENAGCAACGLRQVPVWRAPGARSYAVQRPGALPLGPIGQGPAVRRADAGALGQASGSPAIRSSVPDAPSPRSPTSSAAAVYSRCGCASG